MFYDELSQKLESTLFLLFGRHSYILHGKVFNYWKSFKMYYFIVCLTLKVIMDQLFKLWTKCYKCASSHLKI